MYSVLKKQRNIKNMSCEDMAKVLELSKATYSKKENRKVKFSLDEAKTISAFFGIPIETLFADGEINTVNLV